MDPISAIVAALAAGAIAAAKDTATTAIKDAYHGLKSLIKNKLSSEPQAQAVGEPSPPTGLSARA